MAEATADDTGFYAIAAYIASFANRIGIVADSAVSAEGVCAIGSKGVIPDAGRAGMIHAGIGRGGIAAHVNTFATRPLVIWAMAGRQGRGDEDEVNMLALFHFVVMKS